MPTLQVTLKADSGETIAEWAIETEQDYYLDAWWQIVEHQIETMVLCAGKHRDFRDLMRCLAE